MNVSQGIDDFLKKKNHPFTNEIQKIREMVLAIDPSLTEAIKWNSPTFIYKGNIASFFMNAKKFVSLMFHKGAMLNDDSGLLEGDGREARVAHFNNIDEIISKNKRWKPL